jgi:Ca2+-dependent lipid-binding protein
LFISNIICDCSQIVYKTLNPNWNQTIDFNEDGSPLVLHVKDYNRMLPVSSIGHCLVEYDRIPPNQTVDRWLPLTGVPKGEIHFQLTRWQPELERAKQSKADAVSGSLSGTELTGPLRLPAGSSKLQKTSGKVRLIVRHHSSQSA